MPAKVTVRDTHPTGRVFVDAAIEPLVVAALNATVRPFSESPGGGAGLNSAQVVQLINQTLHADATDDGIAIVGGNIRIDVSELPPLP